MNEIEVRTWTANIFCGIREGYHSHEHESSEAESICRAYCDEVGLCVSVTQTTFVYTGGSEPGVIVGLIHYPRFPHESPENVIRKHAAAIAKRLKEAFRQERITIVYPDMTVMLEKGDKQN